MVRPSEVMPVGSELSNHEYGCMSLSPGKKPIIWVRQLSRDSSTRPSFETSCRRIEGDVSSVRILPESVTARMESAQPVCGELAANHTSLPPGPQASPSRLMKPVARVV